MKLLKLRVIDPKLRFPPALVQNNYINPTMNFKFNNREKLVQNYKYNKQIKIEEVFRTGTILIISLEGIKKVIDNDFLNKLIDIFKNNSLYKKN